MKKRVALVIVPTLIFGSGISSAAGNQFQDIQSHWAKPQIESLTKLGVMAGYKDHTFKPRQNITHAEFITLLSRALQLPKAKNSYLPYPYTHWFARSIESAIEAGILNLTDFEKLDLNQPISRKDTARMIGTALRLGSSTAPSPFLDVEDGYITRAFQEYLLRGYLIGGKREFHPAGFVTRAEAAVMIQAVMDYKKDPRSFKEKAKQKEEEQVANSEKRDQEIKSISLEEKERIITQLRKIPVRDSEKKIDELHKKMIENKGKIYSADSMNQFVQTSMDFTKVYFCRDYRTLDAEQYKEQLLSFYGTTIDYKGKIYHPRDFVDQLINETVQGKIIQEKELVTDPSLIYLNDQREVVVRGREIFRYENNLHLPKDLRFNQWYEKDVEIILGSPYSEIQIDWERPEYVVVGSRGISPVRLLQIKREEK